MFCLPTLTMTIRPPHYPYNTLIETYCAWGQDPDLPACLSEKHPGGLSGLVRLVLKIKKSYIFELLGHFDQGLSLLQEALGEARSAGLVVGQAEALLSAAEVWGGKGEFARMKEAAEQALATFEKALQLAEIHGVKEQIASCLFDTGKLYSRLHGDNERALRTVGRAMALCEETGDIRSQAACLSTLGVFHNRMGNVTAALINQQRALAHYESMGDRYGQSVTLENIGSMEGLLGNYPRALSAYARALELTEAMGNPSGSAYILNDIGNAYEALGENERAVEHLQRSLAIRRECGERQKQAVCLMNLVSPYLCLGDLDQARLSLSEAQAIAREADPGKEYSCRLAQTTAAVALESGDLWEAGREIDSGLLLSEALSSKRHRAQLLSLRAGLKDKQGDWQGSTADFTESINLLGSLGEKAELAMGSYHFGQALLAHGEKDKGRWYLGEAKRLFRDMGAQGWLSKMELEGR